MVALVLDGLVGFPAGLSPASFHLFPSSFHVSPSSFHLSPRLGACGRVPGWLVSHFLSFVPHFFSLVSQFFSFVSQAGCLWSRSRPACLPLLFIVSHFFSACGWVPVLVVGFPASSHFLECVSHFFSLSPRLGACGRVPGRLVSHFFSFVSHFFSACGWVPGRLVSHFLLCVSHFFSFVSHFFFCLWSGSRLGACGRVPGSLVSHFLSFSVLVVGFPASSHFLECVSHFFSLSTRLGACGPVPGWLVSHFLACVSHFLLLYPASFHLSPRLGACSRVSGRLVVTPNFFPEQFALNSFLRCVRPLRHCWCPPICTDHVAFLFICLPGLSLLVSALFRWSCSIPIRSSPRSVTAGVRPFPLAMQHFY